MFLFFIHYLISPPLFLLSFLLVSSVYCFLLLFACFDYTRFVEGIFFRSSVCLQYPPNVVILLFHIFRCIALTFVKPLLYPLFARSHILCLGKNCCSIYLFATTLKSTSKNRATTLKFTTVASEWLLAVCTPKKNNHKFHKNIHTKLTKSNILLHFTCYLTFFVRYSNDTLLSS